MMGFEFYDVHVSAAHVVGVCIGVFLGAMIRVCILLEDIREELRKR